jgi:hypothetical protein
VQILTVVIKCMFLSGERVSRVQAAKTLANISGAVAAFPVSGLRLNRCFLRLKEEFYGLEYRRFQLMARMEKHDV